MKIAKLPIQFQSTGNDQNVCSSDKGTSYKSFTPNHSKSDSFLSALDKDLLNYCFAYQGNIQNLFSKTIESLRTENDKILTNYQNQIKILEDKLRQLNIEKINKPKIQKISVSKLIEGDEYIFLYDHRNNKYFIPSKTTLYFLSPDDSVYKQDINKRKPFITGKVGSIRTAKISLPDNRFKLDVGTEFCIIKRL